MYWFTMIVSATVALSIIAIGLLYVANPGAATPSFGLPLPDASPTTQWWLRLKGTRNIVSGLVLLAILFSSRLRLVGVFLALLAIIPLGDMALILVAGGFTWPSVCIHGATAALMIAAAIAAVAARN